MLLICFYASLLFWQLISPLGLTPHVSCHQISSRLTGRILVDDGDRLPLVELHDVQHGPADGRVLRVEVNVEAVFVVHWRVFPACLDVRDFQGVTDRLDRADGWAVRGAKDGPDTQSQLVTGWSSESNRRERK